MESSTQSSIDFRSELLDHEQGVDPRVSDRLRRQQAVTRVLRAYQAGAHINQGRTTSERRRRIEQENA